MIKKLFINALFGIMSLMIISGTALAHEDSKMFTFNFESQSEDYSKFSFFTWWNMERYTSDREEKYLFKISGTSDRQIRKIALRIIHELNVRRIIIYKSKKDADGIVDVTVSKDVCNPGYLKEDEACKEMEADILIVNDFLVDEIFDAFLMKNPDSDKVSETKKYIEEYYKDFISLYVGIIKEFEEEYTQREENYSVNPENRELLDPTYPKDYSDVFDLIENLKNGFWKLYKERSILESD